MMKLLEITPEVERVIEAQPTVTIPTELFMTVRALLAQPDALMHLSVGQHIELLRQIGTHGPKP